MLDTQLAFHLTPTFHFASGNPTRWPHVALLGWTGDLWIPAPGLALGFGPGMSNPSKMDCLFCTF